MLGPKSRPGSLRQRPPPREGPAYEPDHLDELLVIGSFVRRPPPEVRVVPLDRDQILARLGTSMARAA